MTSKQNKTYVKIWRTSSILGTIIGVYILYSSLNTGEIAFIASAFAQEIIFAASLVASLKADYRIN